MTNPAALLRLVDLRQACARLLDAVEHRFGEHLSLSEHDVGYYWNVGLRAAFDMVDQPEQHIDCGHTTDDLAELIGMLQRDPDDVVPLWHDLQHLAGLLRMLAYLDLPDAGRPAAIQR